MRFLIGVTDLKQSTVLALPQAESVLMNTMADVIAVDGF
jgi:hypothetical protein